MTYESIDYRQTDGVARITLDRPKSRNRFTSQLRHELLDAIDRAQDEARVLLVTGRGAAFSLGHDFGAEPCVSACAARKVLLREYWPVIDSLANCPIPTLAAVNGPAIGTGVSIALACDIVIAKDRAVFALPFAALGFVPDAGCLRLLMQRAGAPRALAAAFLGDPISGALAADWGMISQSVSSSEFATVVERRLQKLASLPEAAARGIKLIAQEGMQMTLKDYALLEADIQDVCINAPGFRSP
jgi:2-(1,2-epoxy-1,2-dihydrophenyl)acetyl-CoA isomerase